MARIDWIIKQRLQSWSRSVHNRGSSVRGFASVNLEDPAPGVREPYAPAPSQANETEDCENSEVVQRLLSELTASVRPP
jgi:hypothetical protein